MIFSVFKSNGEGREHILLGVQQPAGIGIHRCRSSAPMAVREPVVERPDENVENGRSSQEAPLEEVHTMGNMDGKRWLTSLRARIYRVTVSGLPPSQRFAEEDHRVRREN